MAVRIHSRDRVHFLGDSLTAGFSGIKWFDASGSGGADNFLARLNGALNSLALPDIARRTGQPSKVIAGTSRVTNSPRNVQSSDIGASGQGIDYFNTNFAATVTAFLPIQVLFFQVGVNDAASGHNLGTFQTAAQAFLTSCLAANAAMRILWIGCMSHGEIWQGTPAAPVWGGNDIDAAQDAINNEISIACTAKGATYVDWRAPLLTYETINNPGKVASGIATSDGTHQNQAGQAFQASATMPYLSIGP